MLYHTYYHHICIYFRKLFPNGAFDVKKYSQIDI